MDWGKGGFINSNFIRKYTAAFAICLAVAWTFASYTFAQSTNDQNSSSPPTQLAAPAGKIGQMPVFDHIFIIVEENRGTNNIFGNPAAPFLNSLRKTDGFAVNYHAIEHPSLPNYMDLVGGDNGGIVKNDCEHLIGLCVSGSRNIMDSLEGHGLSWKAYFESMDAPCEVHSSAIYDIAVNPFVHYKDVVDNPSRCRSHVVPYDRLGKDLSDPKTTANLNFIIPNICDDMHSCPVGTGDKWLAREVSGLLGSGAFTEQNSLLAITWDESDITGDGNTVPLILIGPAVKGSYHSSNFYTHYSLLKLVESSWGLPALTNNVRLAPSLTEFFEPNQPSFQLIY